jgi:hypothetical protein
MVRRLFNVLAAVSLLLCIATTALDGIRGSLLLTGHGRNKGVTPAYWPRISRSDPLSIPRPRFRTRPAPGANSRWAVLRSGKDAGLYLWAQRGHKATQAILGNKVLNWTLCVAKHIPQPGDPTVTAFQQSTWNETAAMYTEVENCKSVQKRPKCTLLHCFVFACRNPALTAPPRGPSLLRSTQDRLPLTVTLSPLCSTALPAGTLSPPTSFAGFGANLTSPPANHNVTPRIERGGQSHARRGFIDETDRPGRGCRNRR